MMEQSSSVPSETVVDYVRHGDHIAIVTLRRPASHNAVSKAVAEALSRIVEQVEDDPVIRVAIITGAGGRSFCAGADLKETAAGGMSELFLPGKGFAGFVDAARTKPWIAAVDGNALAGGCEIALACDMIVASTSSQFGLPEVKRGLIAGAGGAYRLARLIPRNLAIELVLTGRNMSAQDAHRLGLVNQLIAPGEAIAAAIALAEEVIANAPLAVAASLELLRNSADLEDTDLAASSQARLKQLGGSADYLEGVTAFLEKRPPRWNGS